MIKIVNKSDCCGCNACGDICPRNAISFKVDNEGFWYPFVDAGKCVDCGLCENVCPMLNVETLKKNDFVEPVCYAAEHKNLEVIFDSTSGGLFSAFADVVYKDGGWVGGAIFNEDFSVSHFISNDKSDLPRLRSSKYLQSNLSGFYSLVKELLEAGERVLVCGTPCQMAALRAFLGKDYEDLIILDFVCRGINSPKINRKYLDSFEERYGSPVVYSKAKSKEYGWRNLTHKVILADGRIIYETKDMNNFTKGYLQTNVFSRPSCYSCKFKGFPRIADITLADFWGIEKIDPSLDKDLGTSLVLLNSKKGLAYFERAKARTIYRQVSLEGAIEGNPALVHPLDPPRVDRDSFFRDLDEMPFTKLAEKYLKDYPEGRKAKVKAFLRRLLNLVSMFFDPSISFFKTLRYSSLTDILRRNFLLVKKNTALDISKGAELNLKGVFSIGSKRVRGSRLESRILLEKGSTLISDGDVAIAYGADIELFENATLHFKGGTGANINFTIICADHIEIGKDVVIGRGVTIRDNNGNHYINRAGYKKSRPVIIGNKVWLCEGCTIMSGVKIGDGAIIGAHAFVTTNVPAHALVSGNPAVIVDEDVLWKY